MSFLSFKCAGALKCLTQGHSHDKNQRIHCSLNPGFLDYESNTLPLTLLKKLWEEEKMLITIFSPFPTMFSTLPKLNFSCPLTFIVLSANASNFYQSKILSFGKISGFHKLKAFAEDKLNVTQDIKVVFHRIENIVGKERKCWLPAFSSFPTMFSNGLFLQCVESRHFVVKG